MLHINIIAIGKIRESYWNEAIQEYLKRLEAFADVKITEIKEESFSAKDNKEIIKAKEAEHILKAISKDSFIFLMDEKGKEYTSQELSKQIEKLQLNNSTITFIIGGALGLHEKIKKRADLTLSLSKMTFAHGMARVFLLEQIYRSFMISNNRTYHY